MERNILKRVNNRIDYWGPKIVGPEVVNMPCPIDLTFDNNVFSWDSSCMIMDTSGGRNDFSSQFDTSDFLFSSDSITMDNN